MSRDAVQKGDAAVGSAEEDTVARRVGFHGANRIERDAREAARADRRKKLLRVRVPAVEQDARPVLSVACQHVEPPRAVGHGNPQHGGLRGTEIRRRFRGIFHGNKPLVRAHQHSAKSRQDGQVVDGGVLFRASRPAVRLLHVSGDSQRTTCRWLVDDPDAAARRVIDSTSHGLFRKALHFVLGDVDDRVTQGAASERNRAKSPVDRDVSDGKLLVAKLIDVHLQDIRLQQLRSRDGCPLPPVMYDLLILFPEQAAAGQAVVGSDKPMPRSTRPVRGDVADLRGARQQTADRNRGQPFAPRHIITT